MWSLRAKPSPIAISVALNSTFIFSIGTAAIVAAKSHFVR